MNKLAPRERQCLALLAEGKRVDEVADIVGISKRTVEFYLTNARQKLQAKTTLHAILIYLSDGSASEAEERRRQGRRFADKVAMLVASKQAAAVADRSTIQEVVEKSYVRCVTMGRFAEDVYKTLFEISAPAAARFANTNMVQQARLLDYGIRHFILFFHEPHPVTATTLVELGESHAKSRMNIEPELYDFWLAAVLTAVAKNDPGYEDQLTEAWHQVLNHGIAVMRSMYDQNCRGSLDGYVPETTPCG